MATQDTNNTVSLAKRQAKAEADFNKLLLPGITVSRSRLATRFVARPTIDGKKVSLGTFVRYEDAKRAVCEAKILGGTIITPDMLANFEAAYDGTGRQDDTVFASFVGEQTATQHDKLFALLETVPPHELSTDAAIEVWSEEDSSMVTIAPNVTAAYLKKMQDSADAQDI